MAGIIRRKPFRPCRSFRQLGYAAGEQIVDEGLAPAVKLASLAAGQAPF